LKKTTEHHPRVPLSMKVSRTFTQKVKITISLNNLKSQLTKLYTINIPIHRKIEATFLNPIKLIMDTII
jgi:hypothetical protein